MKHIYAFETKEDYEKYHSIIENFRMKLADYQKTLEEEYALMDSPKGVIWTTQELATTVFSDIPIPAYTNKDLIYMSPDLTTWETIFEKQLDGKVMPDVQQYYKEHTESEMFVILAQN
jgi:hypothetical protein